MPPGCSTSVRSRCSGVISAWLRSLARLCAAITASWAFSVSLFVLMSSIRAFRRRCVSARPAWPAPRSVPRPAAMSVRGQLGVHPRVEMPLVVGCPTAGMPYPFSRKTWPFCVSGGTRSRAGSRRASARPTWPPSTAVVTGTGTFTYRSCPLRSNVGCGVSRTRRNRSPGRCAAGARFAFAGHAHARAVADARQGSARPPPRLAVVLQRSRRVAPRYASSSVSSISCSTSRPARARARRRRGAARAPAAEERGEEVGERVRVAEHLLHLLFASSCGSRRRLPAARGLRERRSGPPRAWACSYIRQLEPSSSYFLRVSGLPRTSLASLISLKRASAALSPGLTSGWSLRASLPERLLDLLLRRGLRDAERGVVVLELHRVAPYKPTASLRRRISASRRRRPPSVVERPFVHQRPDALHRLADDEQALHAGQVDPQLRRPGA